MRNVRKNCSSELQKKVNLLRDDQCHPYPQDLVICFLTRRADGIFFTKDFGTSPCHLLSNLYSENEKHRIAIILKYGKVHEVVT